MQIIISKKKKILTKHDTWWCFLINNVDLKYKWIQNKNISLEVCTLVTEALLFIHVTTAKWKENKFKIDILTLKRQK